MKRKHWIWIAAVAAVLVFSGVALAQAPGSTPSSITQAYRNSRAPALAAFNRYAGGLFRALALVEMAWTAVLLVLERSDLQSWTAGMLRKLLVLFAFLYLIQNGAGFADRIMNSFIQIGSEAAGVPAGHSPGDIFFRGVEIATTLASKSALSGFIVNPGSTLAIILSALLVFLSFTVVTIHYVMAQVESYIVVSTGLIFLAFGGHSITRPYVERFFALAVAVGVKLMVLYMVIAIGTNLSATWNAVADNISVSIFPFQDCFDLIGGSMIFASIAWGVPKFVSSILAGSPAFSGGDVISIGVSAVQAAMLAAGGAAAVAKYGAGGAAGGFTRLAVAAQHGGGGGGSQPPSSGSSGPLGGGPSGGDRGGGAPYAPTQPAPPAPPSSPGGRSGQVGPPAPTVLSKSMLGVASFAHRAEAGAAAVQRTALVGTALAWRAGRLLPPEGGGGGSLPSLKL